MCVLSGVNVMLRKIAVAAASKPSVEITQDGETLSVKTSTSVRTTHVTFTVGQEFNEATVDGRPCTVHTHPQKNTSVILLYICLSVTYFPFPKHSNVQEPMKCVFMQSWSLMWTQSHPPSQRSYQIWHTPIPSTSISGFHILMGTDLFLTLSISKEKHCLHIFVCLCFSQSFPCWETDSKISCEQTLQKGEGPKTSWTREMTNDGELILVRFIPAIMCYRYDSCTQGSLIIFFLLMAFILIFWQTMTADDVVCTRVYVKEWKYEETGRISILITLSSLTTMTVYHLFPFSLISSFIFCWQCIWIIHQRAMQIILVRFQIL